MPQLPSKAPYTKRFEDSVGRACESAAAAQVARRMGLSLLLKAKRVAVTSVEFLAVRRVAKAA
jgi:hypothetical protein